MEIVVDVLLYAYDGDERYTRGYYDAADASHPQWYGQEEFVLSVALPKWLQLTCRRLSRGERSYVYIKLFLNILDLYSLLIV